MDDRLRTGEMVMDDEWKGKHLEVSFGFQGDKKIDEGRVARTAEHRFSEVLDPNVRADQGAKACRDTSNDRWTKRVKREVVVDESREHVWETNEDQGSYLVHFSDAKSVGCCDAIWVDGNFTIVLGWDDLWTIRSWRWVDYGAHQVMMIRGSMYTILFRSSFRGQYVDPVQICLNRACICTGEVIEVAHM